MTMPDGVTRLASEDKLENILNSLIQILEGNEKNEAITYKNLYETTKKELELVKKEQKTQLESAKEKGLSEEQLSSISKEFGVLLLASNTKMEKTTLKIADHFKKIEDEEDKKFFNDILNNKDKSISNFKIPNNSSLKSNFIVPNNEKQDSKIPDDSSLKSNFKIPDSKKQDSRIPNDSSLKSNFKIPDSVKQGAESLTDAAIKTSLGMFSVVTGPLESLLGFKLENLVKSGFAKVFKKKEKKEEKDEDILKKKVVPRKEALLKAGLIGSAAVFLSGALKGTAKAGGAPDEEIGFNKEMLTGAVLSGAGTTSIASKIVKAIPLASLVIGVLWGVIDSIKATMKSGEWGVSKISAAIGGFLAGSGNGGIKDAFLGMGKWALIGAGIGSFVPVVGTIAGGLIGAALGGILGWIGGEKVSGVIDTVGKWAAEKVTLIKDTLLEWLIPENVATEIDAAFSEEGTLWDKIKASARLAISTTFGSVVAGFTSTFDGLKKDFIDIKTIFADDELTPWEKVQAAAKKLLSGMINAPLDFIKGLTKNVEDLLSSTFGVDIDILGLISSTVSDYILTPLKNSFLSMFSLWKTKVSNITEIAGDDDLSLWDKVKGIGREIIDGVVLAPLNAIKTYIDTLTSGNIFKDAKKSISGIFENIGETIQNFLIGLLPDWAKKAISWTKSKISSEPSGNKIKKTNDAIIYKDDSIYEPSPDDNILVTKNKPIVINSQPSSVFKNTSFTTKEVVKETHKESEKIVNKSTIIDKSSDTTILLLQSILKVLNNKNMAPSFTQITQKSGVDFDNLR